MLKNKKVVIFDLDGTLIDSIGIWNDIDIDLIKAISGIEPKEDIAKQRDEKLKEYRDCKDTYLEYCKFLKEKYKSNMTKEQIKEIRYKIADKYLKEKIDYKPYADKLLRYLKEKGYILCIASTTNDHTIDTYKKYNKNIISKLPLDNVFTLIYSKDAVKNLKPDPEVHYKILEELQVKREDCIIVEDSLIGVEAANNANIDVISIYDKYSDYNREEINKSSQYRFNDFKEMLEFIKKEID